MTILELTLIFLLITLLIATYLCIKDERGSGLRIDYFIKLVVFTIDIILLVVLLAYLLNNINWNYKIL